jgi:hypothetical protein
MLDNARICARLRRTLQCTCSILHYAGFCDIQFAGFSIIQDYAMYIPQDSDIYILHNYVETLHNAELCSLHDFQNLHYAGFCVHRILHYSVF